MTQQIVSAAPIVHIILPPQWSVTRPVTLGEQLAGDLLRLYGAASDELAAQGEQTPSFNDWLVDLLQDFADENRKEVGA